MARPREPVDLIAAKGRKHLTIAEYVDRKNAEVTAAADNVKPPAFLLKKEREKFNELAIQLVDLKIMTNLDWRYVFRCRSSGCSFENHYKSKKYKRELLRDNITR